MNPANIVGIHPLVIASSCDHYTRVSEGGSKLPKTAPVIGLLFGTKSESETSICDSTDAIYDITNGEVVPVLPEIEKKRNLWTAVNTHYQLLGWYSFGKEATSHHVKFHDAISSLIQSPLFLLVNNEISPDSKRLPLALFNAESHGNSKIFVDVPFKIENSPIEKIALDQITKSTPTNGQSKLEIQNQSMLTSMKTMNDKLAVVIKILQDMKDQKMKIDHDLVRKAAKICHMLPPVDNSHFNEDFANDITDSLIMTYLGAVSKTAQNMYEVSDTLAVVSESNRSWN